MATETITGTTIKAGVALAALDQALIATGNGDSRPILTGIEVRATDKAITFTASDSYRLVTVNVPAVGGLDWRGVLDGEAVKAAITAIKAAIKAAPKYQRDTVIVRLEYVDALPDGPASNRYGAAYRGHVIVTAGIQRVIVPTLDGAFPNCEQLIPEAREQNNNRSAFNGALIGEVFSKAAKYAGAGIVRVHLPSSPSQPTRLDWHADGGDAWSATAVVMPMFATWGD